MTLPAHVGENRCWRYLRFPVPWNGVVMKRITLVRHAKSSWDTPTLADIDRPLAGRGKRDRKLLASLAAAELPVPDLLLVSPAKRTRDTAAALAAVWPDVPVQEEAALYLASASQLGKRLRRIDDAVAHVVVVGHHPGVSRLAVSMASECAAWLPERHADGLTQAEPTLVTGALASFTVPVAHWRQWNHTAASFDTLMAPAYGVQLSARYGPWLTLLREQLATDIDASIAVLALHTEPKPDQVHLLRSRVKRLRAMLRLLRNDMGERSWRRHDARLRALAQYYGELRDGDVLSQQYAATLPRQDWPARRTRLWQKLITKPTYRTAPHQLRKLLVELTAWPAAAVSNASIATALCGSYAQARRAWRQANKQGDDAHLHRLRIRAKRLLFQLRVLEPVMPSGKSQKWLDGLAELLGEQHDLTVAMLAMQDDAARQRAGKQAKRLGGKAVRHGRRLFMDKTPAWLLQGYRRKG